MARGAQAGAGARSWRCAVALVCALAAMAAVSGLGAQVAFGAGLPDGRGYELVSAADKNGGDVVGSPERVRVADDGSAVMYSSLKEFGNTVGGGIATDYLSVRSPAGGGQGWVTHGIIPPQTGLTFAAVVSAFEPRYEQDFSPDLSTGVLLAWRPLTGDPLVANVANLYWRDDLLSAGGDYRLVSGCSLCIGPISSAQLPLVPFMVASTPDLSRVLFESQLNLAPGARGSGTKLYEWDAASGSTVLAGVLPDGSGALDSAAGVGHGLWEHRHAISRDGRKVFFMATVAGVQNVYMRVDERTTVQLNRSELTAGPETPQSAQYGDASLNGEHVFFTTPERLTDDAPPGGGVYMYDTTLPDSDPHHLTFIAPGNRIIGTSADGQTTYYLAPGAALTVWHDSATTFVANIPNGDLLTLVEEPLGTTTRISPSGEITYLSAEPTPANPFGSCPQTTTRACDMLYVYTPGSLAPRCVSCHPDGTPPSTSVEVLFVVSGAGAVHNGHLNRMVTDDGRRVFFTTSEALVPEDVNGKRDAYEYDVASGTVSLISSGRSTADSYFVETNPDGRDALFFTREQLVGWDVDTNYDIYDARIGGGLPEPVPPPPGCSGQDCHPTPTTPPAFAPTTSQTTHTVGNLKQHLKPRTKPCPHGQTRQRIHNKTRCVKHKARKAAHAARRPRNARRSR